MVISDKLEAAGLIERRPHPNDGRARVLALTADGRGLWSRLPSVASSAGSSRG